MALYRLARRGTVVTINQASSDIATPTALGVRARLMELHAFNAAATACHHGLNRTTALGTRTSPVALLPEEPADPVLTGIRLVDVAIAHSVQPTLAAEYLERWALPATIGSGIILTFPRGLTIAHQLSLAVINIAASSAAVDTTYIADV